MGRRAHERLRSLGRRRENRAAQERAREGPTDARPRSATTSAPATAPASSAEVPAACYFPRDLFFCFFTFKLGIGAFASVPSEMGLGTRCLFDFPATPILLDRGRAATDNPTLQAVGGCAVLCAGRSSRPTLVSPERGAPLRVSDHELQAVRFAVRPARSSTS